MRDHIDLKEESRGLGDSMNVNFKAHSTVIIAELKEQSGFGE